MLSKLSEKNIKEFKFCVQSIKGSELLSHIKDNYVQNTALHLCTYKAICPFCIAFYNGTLNTLFHGNLSQAISAQSVRMVLLGVYAKVKVKVDYKETRI